MILNTFRMTGKPNFIQHFKKMKTYDGLAIGALGLNIFAVYTNSNIGNIQELLEPMASRDILVIQLSALMAGLYLIEYFGDSEGSSSNDMFGGISSSNEEGFTAMISGLLEEGIFSKIVDALSIAAVFMGYSYISENVSYGTSITEISTNPEVIAMQVSVVMMINFGIVLVSDLLSKKN